MEFEYDRVKRSGTVMGWCLAIFVILFFSIIISNGINHSDYVEEFTVRCESNGGVVFIPKGVKGWPVPECRNPAAFIVIE